MSVHTAPALGDRRARWIPNDHEPQPDPLTRREQTLLFISRMVVASAVWLALFVAVPAFAVGWGAHTITGSSMEPLIQGGDVVLTQTPNEGTEVGGSVITYEQSGRLVSHRAVRQGETPGTWITKGDASAREDSSPVHVADVRGIGRLLVPFAGLPTYWSHTGQWSYLFGLLVGLAACLTCIHVLSPHRRKRRSIEGRLLGVAVIVIALGVVRLSTSAAAMAGETSNDFSSLATVGIETPTGLTAVPQDALCLFTNVDLDWTLSASPEVTEQEIRRSDGGGPFNALAFLDDSTTSYTDNGITCGVEYTYQVIAVADFGATFWESPAVDGVNQVSVTATTP